MTPTLTPRAFWDRHGDLWEFSPDRRHVRLVWTSGERGPRTFTGGYVPFSLVRRSLVPMIPTA